MHGLTASEMRTLQSLRIRMAAAHIGRDFEQTKARIEEIKRDGMRWANRNAKRRGIRRIMLHSIRGMHFSG